MNVKSVRITKCSNSELWYWGMEGEKFEYRRTVMTKRYSYEKAAWEDVQAFIVTDSEGLPNVINNDDGYGDLNSGVRVWLK